VLPVDDALVSARKLRDQDVDLDTSHRSGPGRGHLWRIHCGVRLAGVFFAPAILCTCGIVLFLLLRDTPGSPERRNTTAAEPTMYPPKMTAAQAPIECEVFQIDILVAELLGRKQLRHQPQHGGKPMPCTSR